MAKSKTIYQQEYDGQWIRPNRKSYKITCCDCGLVHRLQFKVLKRVLYYRAWRDQRATGQRRRYNDYSLSQQNRKEKV